uniref:Protein regulator of cytokinesis 1b n=1 Tax=Gadus morhua TaxID=8049 RepID=A0A8C5AA61_GADMO
MRKSEVLAAESVTCLNKALHHLKDIWEEIGISEDQRLQRTNVVKSHIKSLLDMMVAEEEALKKRLMISIETCRSEMAKLCLELQLPRFEEEAGSTMLQLEKEIRTRVEALVLEKSQRVQQLKALMEQDHDLCDILCSMPYRVNEDSVPSLEQLEGFREHVTNQMAEKGRRHAEFVDIKRQIILCMDDLDQVPETSFEKDIVCEDDEAFCLSRDNITFLKLLLCQLEGHRAENEAQCEIHRERIQRLWDRLQVSQEEREAFSPHMVMSKKRNLDLQAEAQRLEELKLLNMRNVTEAIRSEIAVFWTKCFLSMDQRQEFVPYYSEDFTEELLGLHDDEIQRLRQHYEDHKALFEGVHQWEESWRLFQDLEKKATDPTRFTNRGGNLLKEEKQRTELSKSLPKLEKKLTSEIEAWESEQGREFLVSGQKFMQYVEEQWESHRVDKENEKQERQLKKSKQTEEDMLYGTSVRTPAKRRLLGTPTANKTRRVSPPSSYNGINILAPRTPGRIKPPHAGHQRWNRENMIEVKASPVSGALMTPASPKRNTSITSVATTYSEFLRDLSKTANSKGEQDVINSTVSHL